MKLRTMMLLLLAAVMIASASGGTTSRRKCDPLALRPCAPVIWGEAPSAACCARLREQKRCLCKYRDNPYLSKYINSPDGEKVAAACRLRVRGLRC